MPNPSAVQDTVVQDTRILSPEQEAAVKEHLREILSLYQGRDDELIPILQKVQQEYSYLPELAIKEIAKFLRMPEVTVFGVATFYAQFKFVPTGKNIIRVCLGTACHVRGGTRILKEVEKQLNIKPGETTPDLEYSLETVACFGACALSPVMVVNDKAHGRMTPQKVEGVLNETGSPKESEVHDGL